MAAISYDTRISKLKLKDTINQLCVILIIYDILIIRHTPHTTFPPLLSAVLIFIPKDKTIITTPFTSLFSPYGRRPPSGPCRP